MAFSKEYLEQLTALHSRSKFGSGEDIPAVVSEILENKNITSILDFGSGKGYTSEAIAKQFPDVKLYTYDPVTSPIELPELVDMIYSSDVLEHVEPELIDETLADLFNRASKYQYHLIACHLAKKKLNDGRNAHLIIETPEWWKQKLETFGWTVEYEKITERYVEKYDINVIKYITVLKK
jgi:trans-aconitate methyltransferase